MRAMVAVRRTKGKVAHIAAVALGAALLIAGCSADTSRLDPERARRLPHEGIARRADNIVFRYTARAGTREASWEDRRGSIVVTGETILIHKNEKIGLEITPRTRKVVAVERRGQRVRIKVGKGRAAEIWSFVPSDDAPGWADDLRAVVRAPDPGSRVDAPPDDLRD